MNILAYFCDIKNLSQIKIDVFWILSLKNKKYHQKM